jgi:hypothetical protein
VESAIAAGLLALSKPPYVALVLLFVIPAWRRRTELLRPLAVVVGGSLAVAGLWVSYQRDHSMSLDLPRLTLFPPDTKLYAYHGIDIAAQTHRVVSDPLGFLAVLWHTVVYQGLALPEQMVGLLAQYQVPAAVVAISFLCLGVAAILPDEVTAFQLPGLERAALVALSVFIGVAICFIVYTNANALGAPRIDQLTPRYFLPLLPPLVIGLTPNRLPTSRMIGSPVVRLALALGLVAVLAMSVAGLVHSDFGPSHLV